MEVEAAVAEVKAEATGGQPLQVSKVLKCHKKAFNTAAAEEVAAAAVEAEAEQHQQQRSDSAARV